jgi:phage terminase large subunit
LANLEDLTDEEINELYEIKIQLERERVSPKLEAFREPAPYKSATGGRGAGAKTTGVASLLVQNMESGKITKWLCARETHESLEESSYASIWEQVEFLGYKGWIPVPSNSKIINTKTGGYFKFGGLGDVKSAARKKSLQSYDGCWIEECHGIPMAAWDIILPTFRKPGAEVWTTFNRDQEIDPAYELFFVNPPNGTIAIELDEGKKDNPWFPQILQDQLEHMYKTRPDMAEHVWGGKPLKQGADSVLSRVDIRAAMDRHIEIPEGSISIGCDPADMGDDSTEMYKKKGLKIIDHKEIAFSDGTMVGDTIGQMINNDPSIDIRLDVTGIGTSSRDRCRQLGLKVLPINFAEKANDSDKYANIITEMWFKFAEIIHEIDIPDDPELMQELAGRKYKYDSKGRYILEKKADFKKRLGRSPDKADAMVLTFFQGGSIMMSNEAQQAMRNRRRR